MNANDIKTNIVDLRLSLIYMLWKLKIFNFKHCKHTHMFSLISRNKNPIPVGAIPLPIVSTYLEYLLIVDRRSKDDLWKEPYID